MPGPRSADPLPLRSVPNVSALRSSGTAPLTARFGHLRPPRLRSGRSTSLHSILPLRSVPTPIATTWEPTPASHGLGPAPLRFLRSSLRQTALQDRCGETPPAGGRSSRTLRRRTWSGTGDNSTPDPDQPTTGHLLIYTKPKRTSSRWPDRCGGTPPAGGRSSRTLRRDPAYGRQEKRGAPAPQRPTGKGVYLPRATTRFPTIRLTSCPRGERPSHHSPRFRLCCPPPLVCCVLAPPIAAPYSVSVPRLGGSTLRRPERPANDPRLIVLHVACPPPNRGTTPALLTRIFPRRLLRCARLSHLDGAHTAANTR